MYIVFLFCVFLARFITKQQISFSFFFLLLEARFEYPFTFFLSYILFGSRHSCLNNGKKIKHIGSSSRNKWVKYEGMGFNVFHLLRIISSQENWQNQYLRTVCGPDWLVLLGDKTQMAPTILIFSIFID